MKRERVKKIIFTGVLMVSILFMTITAFAGWQKMGDKWRYNHNGSDLTGVWDIEGKRYCFDENANMVTGWRLISGKWHYFNADGSMAFNQWVGDYYVGNDGAMRTNTWIGSYYVGADGKWVSQNSTAGGMQDNIMTNLGNSSSEYFIYAIQSFEDVGSAYRTKCTVAKAVTASPSFENNRRIGERVKIGNYNYTVTRGVGGVRFNYIREHDGIQCYLLPNVCPNGNSAMRFMTLDGEGWLFDGSGTDGYVYIAKDAEIRLIDVSADFDLLGNLPVSATEYVNGSWKRDGVCALDNGPGWIETDANGIIKKITALYDD